MKIKNWLVLAGAVLVWLAPHDAWASGACTAARFHNFQDTGCNQNYGGAGAPDAPKSCSDCGMPRWWISEPYINLHLSDTPLSYTLSSGAELGFQFFYKQRAKFPLSDETCIRAQDIAVYEGNYQPYVTGANCGTDAFWGHNWNRSVVIKAIGNYLGNPICPPFCQGYYVLAVKADGSMGSYTNLNFTSQICKDLQTQTIITDVAGQGYPKVWEYNQTYHQQSNSPTADASGIYWGDTNIGVVLNYPDGSKDVFGLSAYFVPEVYDYYGLHPNTTNVTVRLLLTQQIDAQGRVVRLGYEKFSPSIYYPNPPFRLKYVVDPDCRTNLFQYTATNNFQLAEIDDPYGRKTSLRYDGSGFMTNITDAVGMTNSFKYQSTLITNPIYGFTSSNTMILVGSNVVGSSSGWLSSLTTPYGTTSFRYYEALDSSVTDGVQQRAVSVSEPTGASQLYYYLHNGSLLSSSETGPTGIPGQTNFDSSSGTGNHSGLNYRNSIRWGRRQFANLSAGVQANLPSNLPAALANLTASDFLIGRARNWQWQGDGVSISEMLASERDPSPDAAGQIEGGRTWYNYEGKPSGNPAVLGSNPQITCIARVLPDGTAQYTSYNYYDNSQFTAGAGLVSDNESSYTKPDGSIGVLTNWFHYAANSVDLISVSNSAGQYVNYGYNGSHQITTATNALNQVTTLGWDSSTFNLTGVQLPAGKSISLSYNSPATPPTSTSAMLQQISISPEGRTFTINNYSAGNPSSVTDDRNLTVGNTWDGLNRLTGTVFPDNTTISNSYYRLDLVAAKDRLGNWTRYAFDGLQHLTTVTNANNAVTTYSWCGCGSMTAILDALTNLTTLNYDNQGNLTNAVFPDYSSVTWQYDLARRMTNAFDGAGRFVQIGYNNQGLPTSVATANGTLRQTIYDALNRTISVTDANGVTVTNQFDAINELLKRTWPDGISEGYGYSKAGLIAYTNRDQKVTRYGRDGAGRLTSVTNANTEVTQFGYDSLNNLTSLIDGLLHQTTWQYNQYGWLTNKTDGLTRNVERFTFNANGWITNRWTPEKGNTGYTFDNVGNLTNIAYASQSSHLSYAYDALNRLTNMVDAVGTTAFSYTPAGRLQSENGPWANDALTSTYVQGLRTALTLSQTTSNWSESFGYDAGWRMTNVVSPAGAFAYSYNFQPASSLVTGIQLPNGANIVNSYDSLARLTGTALNNHWAHALDSYTYTPDALGLRTNIVRNLGLTSSTVTAGFDNIGQVTSWNATEAGGTPRQNEQLGFGYDAAHNLHSRTNGELSQTFTTDAANQLNNVTRTGNYTFTGATPSPAKGVMVNGQSALIYNDMTFAATNLTLANGQNTFTVIATNLFGVVVTNVVTVNLPLNVSLNSDNNGNLTNNGALSFGFDSENQLTNVTIANQLKKEFVFDGLNRLRNKREYGWIGGAWAKTNEVRYVWDGNVIIQLRDSNNVPTLTLTRGLDLSGSLQGAGGIGGLLAMTDGSGANYFYHQDGLGNVTTLMDAQENIVARRTYDAFGRTLRLTGNNGINPFWFSSQLHDEATDIYIFKHRSYLPSIFGWLSMDPIQERGGINLRRFNRNNPLQFVDPLGLLDYYYSPGGFAQPSGPVPYLEGDSWYGQLGASIYNTLPFVDNAVNNLLAPSDIGTDEGAASADGNYWGMFMAAGIDAAGLVPGEGAMAKGEKAVCKSVKKISSGEIKKLEQAGHDIHELKGKKNSSKRDLFKDNNGNIEVRPKSGEGPGDPTGININNP
jgi:RHS repeat-associated protein